MFFYKKIEKNIQDYLLPNGSLLFEINPIKKEYFKKRGYKNISDINGKTRFSILHID